MNGAEGLRAGGFGLDRGDAQVAAFDGLHRQFGLRGISDIELVELLARQQGQTRLVFLPARCARGSP